MPSARRPRGRAPRGPGRSGSAGGGSARLAVAARLPQRLLARVGPAAEDEQQVGEPVEVAHDLGVAVLDVDGAPLGPPADRAADVEVRGGPRPAGEHERPQRLEGRVDLVTGGLEPADLLGREAQPLALAAGRDGEVGADVEELVLHAAQPVGVLRRQPLDRERQADLRVELVDRPVRLDPRVGLRHPAHVAEVRLAAVAELRVDPGEVDRHGWRQGSIRPVQGRWSREAGAKPARTRHCDRGTPPARALRRPSHWTADGGAGRLGRVRPEARPPAPTARLIPPSWKGVASCPIVSPASRSRYSRCWYRRPSRPPRRSPSTCGSKGRPRPCSKGRSPRTCGNSNSPAAPTPGCTSATAPRRTAAPARRPCPHEARRSPPPPSPPRSRPPARSSPRRSEAPPSPRWVVSRPRSIPRPARSSSSTGTASGHPSGRAAIRSPTATTSSSRTAPTRRRFSSS